MARELPNSQPMEQALLGSILIYPSVMQDCQDMDLSEDEFFLPSHQKIFQSMLEIYQTSKIVD